MDAPASEKRIALAAIAGAHGVNGEVRLKLFADSLDSLARHATLIVAGEPRALAARAGSNGPIARIDGITTREAAEALRGTLIEVDRAALPPLEEGEYYHADLIGLTCFDAADATVGSVVAVENFGAGDLLEVETVAGKRALIPFKPGIADLVDARIVLDPQFLA